MTEKLGVSAVDVGWAIPSNLSQLMRLRLEHRKTCPAKAHHAATACRPRRQPCSQHRTNLQEWKMLKGRLEKMSRLQHANEATSLNPLDRMQAIGQRNRAVGPVFLKSRIPPHTMGGATALYMSLCRRYDACTRPGTSRPVDLFSL